MIARISSRATFRSLRRSDERAGCRWFTIVRSDGPPDPPSDGIGLAFALSRRVGNAVCRNHIRRRLRAAVAEFLGEHDCRPGWYLVVVRPAATHATYDELRTAVRAALIEFDRGDQ